MGTTQRASSTPTRDDVTASFIRVLMAMNDPVFILVLSAASIGFIHTVIGPDHYIPFLMMSRVQRWTQSKTLLVTALCGIGHVASSVLLGAIGIALGSTVSHLQVIESLRGDIAAWALIAFGIIYGVWGLKAAQNISQGEHDHIDTEGTRHSHAHPHIAGQAHSHSTTGMMTTWTLFTVFVLGPCEPLIPLMMYPAARHDTGGVVLVAAIFSSVTIATMITTVWLIGAGVARLPLRAFEKYTHALAGGIIAVTGVSIRLFGL